MTAQDVIADQIEGEVLGSGWDVAATRDQANAMARRAVKAFETLGYAVVTAQDAVAVIHAHQYKGTTAVNRPSLMVQCSCGHEAPCEPRQGRIVHSAHVAASLSATAHAEAGEGRG